MADTAERVDQVAAQAARGPIGRRLFRWITLACAGYMAALFLAVALLPDREAALLLMVARTLGFLLAGLCCLWCGWRFRGPERRWRVLMGIACIGATGSMGAGIRFTLEHYQAFAAVPPVSWIHMPYLLPYAAVLAALLVFPSTPLPHTRDATGQGLHNDRHWHVTSILDSVLVAASLGVLVWEIGLGVLFRSGGHPPGLIAFATGDAIVSATVVVLLILIAMFRQPRSPTAAALLAAGLLGMTFTTGVYLVVRANNILTPDPLLRMGTVAAPLLIALSCLAPSWSRTNPTRRTGPRAIWLHTVLPYIPLAMVAMVFFFKISGNGRFGFGEIYTLLILLLLVLVRQMITMMANARLMLRLQDSQRQLHYQAFHDPLTGLANRLLFTDRLQWALARRRQDHLPVALLFCDVDHFKCVNDTLGHAAGDELLRIAATRMTECVRVSDTVARLGGDEFAVLLTDRVVEPEELGRRIAEAIQAPRVIAGQPYRIEASVGLAVATDTAEPVTADILLHHADLAMYEAKRKPSEKLAVYRPEMSLKE
ncbi:diguanylate cyclase domain-containing protein [Parafrankia sp. FMc2]|uniref:diguanylate cyclase domain-containing protein n=1 Tax=Parafrankia sp. FMc2 TaxID=3233196 RepID=UPI0034D4DDC2